MLMGVALGVFPSNLTTPRTVAVEEEGPAAFTAGWLVMQVITVKVTIKVRLFVVIRTNFLPLAPGTRFFSSDQGYGARRGALSRRGQCPIVFL
jgi:hypothetical protein